MTDEAQESFFKKIYRMRGLQREMRKTRALSPREKQELSRLEREVDANVQEEMKRRRSGQQELKM
jgi:hypothetical protein